jgi:hypothetical protein
VVDDRYTAGARARHEWFITSMTCMFTSTYLMYRCRLLVLPTELAPMKQREGGLSGAVLGDGKTVIVAWLFLVHLRAAMYIVTLEVRIPTRAAATAGN